METIVHNITVDGKTHDVAVMETSVKSVTIDDKTFILPVDVANFIGKLGEQIDADQKKRIADDEILDKRINKRVGRVIHSLAAAGMLTKDINAHTAPPAGYEDDGNHTFYSDVEAVIKHGLNTGADLKDSLFNTTKMDY